MKNLVIFFLLLAVHLVGANCCAHARVYNNKVSLSAAKVIKNTHQVKGAISNDDHLLYEATSLNGENPNLLNDEDDDENEDIIKKHVSQPRYLLGFYYTFVSNYRFSFLADRLPSRTDLSYTS